mgnify:CR=1 FL=1
MINNVVLVGRITRDVELRMSDSGKAYTTFSLAVNRAFKGQDGQQQADFINCKVFGKQAENLARYCGKGSMIGVLGSIQVSNFQGKVGNTIYRTEVIANNIQFLDTRNQGQQQQQPTNNNFNNFNQQPNAMDVINQQHQQQGMNFNNTGLRNNNTVFDNFGKDFNPNDFDFTTVQNPFTNE